MPTPMPPEVLRALRVVYALVREGSTTAPPFEVFLAELEEELKRGGVP